MLGGMKARTRKLVLVLGISGLVAAGCGGAASSNSGSSSSPPAGAQGRLTALAGKLGVSEAALQKAMQSARSTQGSRPTDMAAALAKALNLSEAKVQAALQAAGPPRGGGQRPNGGQPPSASATPTT
jgi:hypothetical protein